MARGFAWLRGMAGRFRPGGKVSDTGLEMLMQNSQDVILRLNRDIRLTYVSPASLSVFGVPPEQMMGRALRDYALPEDAPGLIRNGERLFSGEVDTDISTFRVRHPNGDLHWVQVNTRRERDMYGEPTGDFVIVVRDVTVQRELQEKFESLAMTDGLTGLANRRAFDEALDRAWRSALRHKRQLSLMLLDVDFFKKFNDSYGHQVGDQCLCAIAGAVSGASKRPGDLVARYGGEEIAVILEETDGPGAVDVASRVLAAVQALKIPHAQNPAGGFQVSVSVGVATAVMVSVTNATSETALIAAADRALYSAKDGGRNRIASAVLMAAPES